MPVLYLWASSCLLSASSCLLDLCSTYGLVGVDRATHLLCSPSLARHTLPTMATRPAGRAADPSSFANVDTVRIRHLDIDWTPDFARRVVRGSVTYHVASTTGGPTRRGRAWSPRPHALTRARRAQSSTRTRSRSCWTRATCTCTRSSWPTTMARRTSWRCAMPFAGPRGASHPVC